MTSNVDIVKTFLDRAWKDVPSSLAEACQDTLAEEFQSVDAKGNVVMDKAAYIGSGQMMAASFQGFNWVVSNYREDGDAAIVTGHFEGTHTGDLDLSAFGAGVIPASHEKIVWPEINVRWVVEGDKIVREESLDESGGIEAFLAPLMS